jgi:hypothetical protein
MNNTLIEVEIVPQELGLTSEAKANLITSFSGFFAEAARWKQEAEMITDPKLARTARLELKAIRVAAEKTRKELKADSLRMGKAIDGANNILLNEIVPTERHLEDIEKREERRILREIAETLERRSAEYQPLHDLALPFPNLQSMDEDQFQAFMRDALTLSEIKSAAAIKAEADRVAAERKEIEEREAQRAENKKLKEEAEAREAAIIAERKEAVKIQAKKDMEAAKERAIIDKKLKEEAEAREAMESEARRMKDAEASRVAKEIAEKDKTEKLEVKRIEEEKAVAMKALAAPDKEKILIFAAMVKALRAPSLKSKDGLLMADNIQLKIEGFSAWIIKQADSL